MSCRYVRKRKYLARHSAGETRTGHVGKDFNVHNPGRLRPHLVHLKKIQRALDDVNGRLRLLSAHTKGIVFELDDSARVVRIWTSCPKLLSRPESECLGCTIFEVLGQEAGERLYEAALTTMKTGVSVCYEYEQELQNELHYFASESVAVPGSNGARFHAVFWVRDITEQIQMRQKLIRTERLATVGSLAAGVAHEVNNPLAYMMLNAEQLGRTFGQFEKGDSLDDRQIFEVRNCIEMIYDGASHVRNIVNELLQLARPDDPAEPVDLCDAIGLSVDITKSAWENCARVQSDLKNIPRVMANHGRLVQVFTNLLTNAAEAFSEDCKTEGNCIMISAHCITPEAVMVQLRDNGPGIPVENRCRIFDPFYTTKPRGTGLGLAICQRIVSNFNGEIRCEPAQPRGTVVKILLQVATAG